MPSASSRISVTTAERISDPTHPSWFEKKRNTQRQRPVGEVSRALPSSRVRSFRTR